MSENVSILKEAVDVYRSGGERALVAWYAAQSPERQRECQEQSHAFAQRAAVAFHDVLQPAVEAMDAAMAMFANEIREATLPFLTLITDEFSTLRLPK